MPWIAPPVSSIRPPYVVDPYLAATTPVSQAYLPQPLDPYFGTMPLVAPNPWATFGGAAFGMMAGMGMASMFAAPWMYGFGGLGMGFGMGWPLFGSGMWSPFPTFDNWNGGFNLPGPF
jgi:hypothetical protein